MLVMFPRGPLMGIIRSIMGITREHGTTIGDVETRVRPPGVENKGMRDDSHPMIEGISHLTKGVGVIILGDILPGGMMTGTLIDPMFPLKIPSCQSMMEKFLGEHMRLS